MATPPFGQIHPRLDPGEGEEGFDQPYAYAYGYGFGGEVVASRFVVAELSTWHGWKDRCAAAFGWMVDSSDVWRHGRQEIETDEMRNNARDPGNEGRMNGVKKKQRHTVRGLDMA